jgi:hypothetical protein
MKRFALIISNPGELGEENYCHGVPKDVTNYSSFLTDGTGGFWKPSEIKTLNRPSVTEVREQIKQFSAYDYVLAIFAGHGWYSTSSASTVLELRANQSIDSAELRKGAPKQTLILDCCRHKSANAAFAEARDSMMKSASQGPRINNEACRRYYDSKIEACAPGIVVLNACSPGEGAEDDSLKGGYYSSSLLESSKAWVRNSTVNTATHSDVKSAVGAHNDAEPIVKRLSGYRQNPSIEKPRTTPYFPFCVIA